jgi:hypothetical protein
MNEVNECRERHLEDEKEHPHKEPEDRLDDVHH